MWPYHRLEIEILMPTAVVGWLLLFVCKERMHMYSRGKYFSSSFRNFNKTPRGCVLVTDDEIVHNSNNNNKKNSATTTTTTTTDCTATLALNIRPCYNPKVKTFTVREGL